MHHLTLGKENYTQPVSGRTTSVHPPERALAIILAGGRGTRLMNLTDSVAKPAVPFGGTFRIIDFTLSNCINSGFRRMMVLTQYCAESLGNYLPRWQGFCKGRNEFLKLLPADKEKVYTGTADAVYKNLDMIKSQPADWVLILAGDHVYKMDYGMMLDEHISSGADVTIPCIEVEREKATAFGVVHIDTSGRIINFLEKPADPPGMPDNPDMALASMGIYIFNKKFLIEQLERDAALDKSEHDFGKDIIPYLVPRAKVMAHRFLNSCVRPSSLAASYWRDVGTVDAYWEASMELALGSDDFDLNDSHWPIFSPENNLPPAKFSNTCGGDVGLTLDSIISPGCIIDGAFIEKSLLCNKVKVDSETAISESILLPEARIGRNVYLKRAIVDKGCTIPDGFSIGNNPEEDSRNYYRSPAGIVLVTEEMIQALSS